MTGSCSKGASASFTNAPRARNIHTSHEKWKHTQRNHTPYVCALRTLNGRKLSHAPYVSALRTFL